MLEGHAGGIGALLGEAWARYGRPIALTEVHLHAPREDQLRWLWDSWQAACAACREGIDVRAVTVWALLGSRDWDGLLTQHSDYYEPGAFDVRNGRRRPTAIARLARDLAPATPRHTRCCQARLVGATGAPAASTRGHGRSARTWCLAPARPCGRC